MSIDKDKIIDMFEERMQSIAEQDFSNISSEVRRHLGLNKELQKDVDKIITDYIALSNNYTIYNKRNLPAYDESKVAHYPQGIHTPRVKRI